MKHITELGITGCIFGGFLIFWSTFSTTVLIWLFAIPGIIVWWIAARFCAYYLMNYVSDDSTE
jgi:hypothetical protein